uniref:Uncharacterized protein n=1 Tax=Acrobeloides nanus TaxID=290746 RepID=A0A914CCI3_9BILA
MVQTKWLETLKLASNFKTAKDAEMLLGLVVQLSRIGLKRTSIGKIKCPWNKFDDWTKKYWVESEYFWAYDQKSLIKQGDWVIIKPMLHVDSPIKSIRPITHEVEKVVFPFGNRVDPVTKKLAYELKFADDIEFKRNLIVDVIEKPFEEDSLLFDQKRELQAQKIKELKSKDLSKSEDNN